MEAVCKNTLTYVFYIHTISSLCYTQHYTNAATNYAYNLLKDSFLNKKWVLY